MGSANRRLRAPTGQGSGSEVDTLVRPHFASGVTVPVSTNGAHSRPSHPFSVASDGSSRSLFGSELSDEDKRALEGVDRVYSTVFAAQFYEMIMDTSGHYGAEDRLFDSLVLPYVHFPVVDPACGPAHLLVRMLQRGNGQLKSKLLAFVRDNPDVPAIVGVDLNVNTMLPFAYTKLQAALRAVDLPVEWLAADFREEIDPRKHKVVLVHSPLELALQKHSFLAGLANTLIMTYIAHWIGGGRLDCEDEHEFEARTREAKERAMDVISQMSSTQALLFSAEEFDLRVSDTTEQHLPGLAEAVRHNTSPVTLNFWYNLLSTVFSPIMGPNNELIDLGPNGHSMTGASLIKTSID